MPRASAAGAAGAAGALTLKVMCDERGRGINLAFSCQDDVGAVIVVAQKNFPVLELVPLGMLAAFKATRDSATKAVTSDDHELDSFSSLEELGLSTGDIIVVKESAPAAMSGGAAASSGEWHMLVQGPMLRCSGGHA